MLSADETKDELVWIEKRRETPSTPDHHLSGVHMGGGGLKPLHMGGGGGSSPCTWGGGLKPLHMGGGAQAPAHGGGGGSSPCTWGGGAQAPALFV